jgi:hypothetical protein
MDFCRRRRHLLSRAFCVLFVYVFGTIPSFRYVFGIIVFCVGTIIAVISLIQMFRYTYTMIQVKL